MVYIISRSLSHITNVPYAGPRIRTVWRRYLYCKLVARWWRTARANQGPAQIEPFRVYWIAPQTVTHNLRSLETPFKQFTHTGRVIGGSWDRDNTPIEETLLYRGILERYDEGIPWESTEYFERLQERIERGKEPYECSSMKELRERYRRIDDLYERLKTEGYRSQREIVGKRTSAALNDITVHVGRDGQFLFYGTGNHRIRLARYLDLDSVAVRIVVRHTKWQEKRNKLATGEADPTDLGIDPSHPDIQDII